MTFKSVLITVRDIEKARQFYEDLFGLKLIRDNDGNMELEGGLALQDAAIWQNFLQKDIVSHNNATELYFEEEDLEGFVEKLEAMYPDVQYVNRLMTHSWGQKVVRFYDLDGNLIEVGAPME
ncbi:MAG: VOC family protein [Clostridia bacterium]|nr:VOC family protein [Clostridia bacterium]